MSSPKPDDRLDAPRVSGKLMAKFVRCQQSAQELFKDLEALRRFFERKDAAQKHGPQVLAPMITVHVLAERLLELAIQAVAEDLE